MVNNATIFSDVLTAWEGWNLTDFAEQRECLLSAQCSMNELNATLASVMAFHIQQANVLLANPHVMPGPTGETNELYAAGRGVVLVVLESEAAEAKIAAMAQITAALIAGNGVIICSGNDKFNQILKSAVERSQLPTNLVQFVALEEAATFIDFDVRVVGLVGSEETEWQVNHQLANRDGAIGLLVSETDLASLPTSHDPNLVLRFITERTRTINITAVGGNATLLELGS
ncbi:1-pyrroline-5-carboxylate dehydrogenase [Vibrio hangzhouensis]|uniref:Delta-1-pyrroline-5-carboxylate dehydrogenase n=1 Tax=Vibrio hangzhouensis TaxID=462991 RepID=A0A1H6B833_9VIBR|nr:1-pyrroline-5-carboxylate dehydrogenase [Vibrio hangzhouensis]SEG56704.1 delta-1-pyrroline-5-carboxylate dehydrogenase [Vibrio hangzhouensis]